MRRLFQYCGCIALFAFADAKPAPAAPDVVDDYLRAQAVSLDLKADAPLLGANVVETKGRRIFLLGEVHGVAANYPLDFALLRYFHRVAGVRVYLAEISHAHAWYINRYLVSGDPAILDFLFSQMRGFVDCSGDRRDFIVALRKWNLALPSAEKIRVMGVDLERMSGITLAFLRLQLAQNPIPALQRILDDAGDPRAIAARLSTEVAAHRVDYAATLGDRWFDVELAVDNLQDHYVCLADRARFDELRDRVQHGNFLRLAKHDPFAVVYGRMGSAHVLRHRTDRIDHFASLLDAPGSAWAGSIVSFWPLYDHSRHLSFKSGVPGETPVDDDAAEVPAFAQATAAELTLFRLDGPHSPFSACCLLPAGATMGVTTDYIDYAILFKNAGPAVPLAHAPEYFSR